MTSINTVHLHVTNLETYINVSFSLHHLPFVQQSCFVRHDWSSPGEKDKQHNRCSLNQVKMRCRTQLLQNSATHDKYTFCRILCTDNHAVNAILCYRVQSCYLAPDLCRPSGSVTTCNCAPNCPNLLLNVGKHVNTHPHIHSRTRTHTPLITQIIITSL